MAKHRRKRFQIDPKRAARVITVLGVTGAVILTIFFWLFYQPGRKTHEHLVSPQTRLRLSFQPAMVQDYISSLAPGVTRFVSIVPKFTSMQARAFRIDWIHALPQRDHLPRRRPRHRAHPAHALRQPHPRQQLIRRRS